MGKILKVEMIELWRDVIFKFWCLVIIVKMYGEKIWKCLYKGIFFYFMLSKKSVNGYGF